MTVPRERADAVVGKWVQRLAPAFGLLSVFAISEADSSDQVGPKRPVRPAGVHGSAVWWQMRRVTIDSHRRPGH